MRESSESEEGEIMGNKEYNEETAMDAEKEIKELTEKLKKDIKDLQDIDDIRGSDLNTFISKPEITSNSILDLNIQRALDPVERKAEREVMPMTMTMTMNSIEEIMKLLEGLGDKLDNITEFKIIEEEKEILETRTNIEFSTFFTNYPRPVHSLIYNRSPKLISSNEKELPIISITTPKRIGDIIPLSQKVATPKDSIHFPLHGEGSKGKEGDKDKEKDFNRGEEYIYKRELYKEKLQPHILPPTLTSIIHRDTHKIYPSYLDSLRAKHRLDYGGYTTMYLYIYIYIYILCRGERREWGEGYRRSNLNMMETAPIYSAYSKFQGQILHSNRKRESPKYLREVAKFSRKPLYNTQEIKRNVDLDQAIANLPSSSFLFKSYQKYDPSSDTYTNYYPATTTNIPNRLSQKYDFNTPTKYDKHII